MRGWWGVHQLGIIRLRNLCTLRSSPGTAGLVRRMAVHCRETLCELDEQPYYHSEEKCEKEKKKKNQPLISTWAAELPHYQAYPMPRTSWPLRNENSAATWLSVIMLHREGCRNRQAAWCNRHNVIPSSSRRGVFGMAPCRLLVFKWNKLFGGVFSQKENAVSRAEVQERAPNVSSGVVGAVTPPTATKFPSPLSARFENSPHSLI